MKNRSDVGMGRWRRRGLLLAIYGTCALGIGVTLAATPGGRAAGGGGAPATSHPVVSPADKAAAEAQFDKANALYLQKKYAEAQVENDKALKLDPTNVYALLMQSTLKSRLAGGTLNPNVQGGTTGGGGSGEKIPVLTMQQVYMIRLLELGPADSKVVGRIDAKVVEDFWQNVVMKDPLGNKSPAAHSAFTNSSNFTGQVVRIRESHERKYMEQITLTTDPAAFVAFRTSLHTYVLQNCATSDCHGGEKSPGGNFHLLNPATSVEQQYTNYYILAEYGNKDGSMVDRVSPEKSLLLQYSLPWQFAAAKHPTLDIKKLTGPTDGRGRNFADWIKALPFPKPSFGIGYEVPGAAAAPAGAPATATAPATAPK